MQIQGKKEVAEAVLIAALSALMTGLINWGIETAKTRVARKETPQETANDVQADKTEEQEGDV